MLDVIGLGLFLGLAWFLYDSVKAKEAATKSALAQCLTADVQFLDQTVARHKIKIFRQTSGSLGLARIYRFEYSVSGAEREQGWAFLLGRRVQRVILEINDDSTLSENQSSEK